MSTKNKEWKWPLGIFLGYMVFVIGTLSVVFFTFTQTRDLVDEDYYAQTMVFDQHLERKKLAENMENPLELELNGGYIDFRFPPELLSDDPEGQITLFRPSDASMDQTYDIDLDESGTQQIPIDELAEGLWRVQVSWSAGKDEYYVEEQLYL